MITRVFKYGALPPAIEVEPAPALPPLDPTSIRQQSKLGRKYYNQLVGRENLRRRYIAWGGETSPLPPHPPTEIVLEDGKKEKIWCHCEDCQDFWFIWRGRYRYASPLNVKPYRAKAVEEGLYWGTYLMIEEAFSSAWKTTDCFDFVKFKSWREPSVMGVRIQKIKNADRFFKIEQAPDSRKGHKAGQRHTIQVRVGTTEEKVPIWSDPLRFEMHRPLQGKVKAVEICRQWRGEREIWSVNITCVDVPARTDRAFEGVVAIDISWRKLPDKRLRLAFATGADGAEYELAMDEYWQERIARADRIRKARDKRLSELKAQDSRFIRIKKPYGVRDKVFRHNIEEPVLVEWVKRDKHLDQYELGCRRKSVDVRLNAVRVWLAMLRKKYAIVVVKDSAHKEMKEQAKARGLPRGARKQGHHGAPGETLREIEIAFGREENVAVVEAPGTTATCEKCHAIMEVGAELMVYCERCDTHEDRDRVSTRNLLRLYFAGNFKKPTARKTTARFAKRHKNKELV